MLAQSGPALRPGCLGQNRSVGALHVRSNLSSCLITQIKPGGTILLGGINVRTGLRKACTMDTFSKRPPSIPDLPPYTLTLICQIEAIAKLAASPTSELNCTELAAVSSALRRAAGDVDARLGFLASLPPDDRRRPA